MNKKRAKEILIANACCTLDKCNICPWRNTDDCTNTSFLNVIEEAIYAMNGEELMNMKLSDIKISSAFAESVPSEKKMEECRDNWNTFERQDRWIVVDQNGYLIDGYVMYLVLKENNIEETKVKISARRKKRWYRKNTKGWEEPKYRNNPTTYIYGVHPNSKDTKIYMWRVPKSWGNWADNLRVGDMIICNTKNGHSPVIVSGIKVSDTCPVEFPVKTVYSKKIKKHGWWLLNTREKSDNECES